MEILTKGDRRLLLALDSNSRSSYSALAKAVGMSQETVRYRVNRLIEKGVIKKFFTVIDSAKLGFSFHKVLLKLQSADEETVDALVSFLDSIGALCWLVRFEGVYDVGFVVKVEKVMDFSNKLDELAARYSHLITKRSISVNVYAEYLSRDYLLGTKRHAIKPREYSADICSYELDQTNRAILRMLTQDARMSAASISRRIFEEGLISLPISSEAVMQRIKRLEKDKVITGYNLVLNHEVLDQLHYKVLLSLNPVRFDAVDQFLGYCRKHVNIVYLIKALGEWDYELDIEVESVRQYRNLMAELSRACPGTIRDYNGLIVTDIYRYTLYPDNN